MGWATVWATFSQTHLVTLHPNSVLFPAASAAQKSAFFLNAFYSFPFSGEPSRVWDKKVLQGFGGGVGWGDLHRRPGLPDFSRYNPPKREKIYQMTTKYTKWPQHKMYQMATKYTK
jgi:hypothetical protein